MAARVVIVGDRYQPHNVMILVWSVAAGVLHFNLSAGPTVLDLLWPGWAVAGTYVLLGLGGLVGLAGVLWREAVLGMLLERAGQIGVAAVTAVYSMMAFYRGGWQAVIGGGLIACWCAACVWRSWQIHRSLSKIVENR